MVIGHWSLVIGYWLLVIGHWSLVIGHWSLVIGHWSLVIGMAQNFTLSSPAAEGGFGNFIFPVFRTVPSFGLKISFH
jgi:hypothetical protein